MIDRNPYVTLFELAIVRGRTRADLRALTEAFDAMRPAFRAIGVSALDAIRGMRRALDAMARAGVTTHRKA